MVGLRQANITPARMCTITGLHGTAIMHGLNNRMFK